MLYEGGCSRSVHRTSVGTISFFQAVGVALPILIWDSGFHAIVTGRKYDSCLGVDNEPKTSSLSLILSYGQL